MTSSIQKIAFAALALALANTMPVLAQPKIIAETGLVGIRLFDNGYKIVSIYGSPDDVQPINMGGGGAIGGAARGGAPAGAGAPAGGGRGGFGPSAGGGSGGSAGSAVAQESMSPWNFGDEILRQGGPPPGFRPPTGPPPGMGGGPPNPSGGGGFGGPPTQGPGGFGGGGGFPGGGIPGRGVGAPAGGGGVAAPPGEQVTFTRWIYNRNGSRYGFILDRFSRVVQIEAIGVSNPKARTRAGIGFGSTFAQIIQRYAGFSPDGYEIGGNTIVMRFLSRHKVAYRLTRLGQNKPHVVTGIVVAAGKG